MGRIQHVFPGGNTSEGFYSFYEHVAKPCVKRKIILKGGPGVGKSTFMKKVGKYFENLGQDIEYHWCSSDNDSLDGVVIGDHLVCLLDGTAPHVVDPKFPGAVDEIINLGQFWNRDTIFQARAEVISLSTDISRCFNRAYLRLREAKQAVDEWVSFLQEARDETAINRNILALSDEFTRGSVPCTEACRHLFAAAITPDGLKANLETLLDNKHTFFGIKGSPGSGVKELLGNVLQQLTMRSAYAEVYHNPLVPGEIDLIVLPSQKLVMLDVSSTLLDYTKSLPSIKFKRWLDFDQLADASCLNTHKAKIEDSHQRMQKNIEVAVAYIAQAKEIHDQLETLYVPAMDFDDIDLFREELQKELDAYF